MFGALIAPIVSPEVLPSLRKKSSKANITKGKTKIMKNVLATAASALVGLVAGALVGNPYFALVGLAIGVILSVVQSEVQPKYSQYAVLGACMAWGINILGLFFGLGIPYISLASIFIVGCAGALMGVGYFGSGKLLK